MAHAQKPDLVFQRNGRVHLNRRGCQFSRLLAAEECGSVDSNCIDHVPTYSARLLATHSIHIFPLHFPSHASLCAIRFWMRYTIFRLKMWLMYNKPGKGKLNTVIPFNVLNCVQGFMWGNRINIIALYIHKVCNRR